MRERKKLCIAIFSLVALIIIGVFAWTNFSSQTSNQQYDAGSGSEYTEPGEPEIVSSEPVDSVNETLEPKVLESEEENIEVSGTLHDYRSEDGEYRQIHIENWGNEPILVRVKLDEYMEIGPGAGLRSIATDENTGKSIPNSQNFAKSLVDGANIDDTSTWKTHSGARIAAFINGAEFYDFWEWEMGGQKFYFPAPEEYRTNKNFVDTSSPPDLTADSVNAAGVQARQTRLAQVRTMVCWFHDGSPIGDFWVIDQDGWAYWAAPLKPGDSTGLLLNRVTQTTQLVEENFYEINVVVQMATIYLDELNVIRFDDEDNGGWTDSGQALIERIVNQFASSDISFVVHTDFLHALADNLIDVTYTATPSKGAMITEVSYSINEHDVEILYLAGVDGSMAKGTLGAGRILLASRDNRIVFTAKDSAGNTADFIILWFYDSDSDRSRASTDANIFVHTTSTFDNLYVRYIATPSRGAMITEVSYSINGKAEEFLYLADAYVLTAEGSTGEGQIIRVPGENEIVFTIRDSVGNTAIHTTLHWLSYGDFLVSSDMEFVEPLPSTNTPRLFASNRVQVTTNTHVRMKEINNAAESVGGRIVALMAVRERNNWAIEVESQTPEELRRICEKLMDTGLFLSASLALVPIFSEFDT